MPPTDCPKCKRCEDCCGYGDSVNEDLDDVPCYGCDGSGITERCEEHEEKDDEE